MDISISTKGGKFNYRVAGLFINNDKVLIMNDERGGFYYLPGGRVKFFEKVRDAFIREMKEELNIDVKIERDLWLQENFFVDKQKGEKYHELCVYFLVDFSETDLLKKGEVFTINEEKHTFDYKWVTFEELKKLNVFPEFLKDRIESLPNSLEII